MVSVCEEIGPLIQIAGSGNRPSDAMARTLTRLDGTSLLPARRQEGGSVVVGLGTDGGQESLSTARPGVDLGLLIFIFSEKLYGGTQQFL